jgi:acyl-CoA reductase-like NAD-dependent aldehyde dehydrogenase
MQQVEPAMGTQIDRDGIALAQRQWAATPLPARLAIIRKLRIRLASDAQELAETIPTYLAGALSRTVADSIVSEVLPLVEACRFLEREAEDILRTHHLGSHGRPAWLSGVEAEVERAPLGLVLILAAANYPLLLAGVQALQALAAGNAVLWKPAPGTEATAATLRFWMLECGLHPRLLTVLDSSTESATQAIADGVDHVFLTGSAATGQAVMRQLAETLTPSTMELSGCDAVFVLPGADIRHTIRALVFGMRFNGSFTCMAPRRVFLVDMTSEAADRFESNLAAELKAIEPVALTEKTSALLAELIDDAQAQGAKVILDGQRYPEQAAPTLIIQATPSLKSMQTEILAPILTVMRAASIEEALVANAACPCALTASVFGPEKPARQLAAQLNVGNILVNDIVIPTADPRIPFGGRGRSGFGVTRGREGLLAMTVPRTIQIQRSRSPQPYLPTGPQHIAFFAALTEMLHGYWAKRWSALNRLLKAAQKLK